jgi:pimeloyl-ACP methyl ester carboxylesterase
MELISFQSDDRELRGELFSGSKKTAIILLHALTWDRHDGERFDLLAQSLYEDGYSVLLFDFSGSGESADAGITVAKWVEDYKAAINFLESRNFEIQGVVARSLGGLIFAQAHDDRVQTAVLWAPDIERSQNFLGHYSEEQKAELELKGYFFINTPKPNTRSKVCVQKDFILERETIDMPAMLAYIKNPIMVIHGSSDTVVSPAVSKRAMQFLPKGSVLKTIQGADHRFTNHLPQAISFTRDWFIDHV